MICYQQCQQRKHWKIEFTTITYPINEHNNWGDKSEQLYTLTDHHSGSSYPHRLAHQEPKNSYLAKRTSLERIGHLQTRSIQSMEMPHLLPTQGEKGPTPQFHPVPEELHLADGRQLHRRRWRWWTSRALGPLICELLTVKGEETIFVISFFPLILYNFTTFSFKMSD